MKKMVYVTWVDSVNLGGDHWMPVDLIPESLEDKNLMLCRSCGFVLEEDAEKLVLCRDYHEDEVGGVFVIPKGAIVEIKKLKEK